MMPIEPMVKTFKYNPLHNTVLLTHLIFPSVGYSLLVNIEDTCANKKTFSTKNQPVVKYSTIDSYQCSACDKD